MIETLAIRNFKSIKELRSLPGKRLNRRMNVARAFAANL